MNFRKVIERRIRSRSRGVDLVSDVNAVVSANVGEKGGATHVSSKQTVSTQNQEGRK
jgi:hypothetical protein